MNGEYGRCEQQSPLPQRAWGWLAVLIVVWAVELLIMQHVTTHPGGDMPVARTLKDAARRLLLNLTGCTVVACLLPWWALVAMVVGGGCVTLGLIAYAGYFHAPLSWMVIANQWREGLAVSDHGLSLVDWRSIAWATAAVGIKLLLIRRIMADRLPSAARLRTAACSACIYLAAAVAVAGVAKPIRCIRMGTPEYIYGYTVAWVAEMLSFDSEALLAEAVERARPKSDRLTTVEPPLPVGRHVAVVQVESLDFDALHARVRGELVMPRLHALRRQAMEFAVTPFHSTGSSEADFSMLVAGTPNGRVNPFQIAGFPYADALPRLAADRGYRPVALHGNTGSFFARRDAYEQMGFSRLYFSEELGPLDVAGQWDHELLDFSADLLAEATTPVFHFLITITSHGPFDRLPAERRELFPRPADARERYLNSMRYVDRALGSYIDRLPQGTTVVIYGDHESGIEGYAHGGLPGRVPWLILQKGADLAAVQRSRGSAFALSGELTQLDMACYFRSSLAAATPAATVPGAGLATVTTP